MTTMYWSLMVPGRSAPRTVPSAGAATAAPVRAKSPVVVAAAARAIPVRARRATVICASLRRSGRARSMKRAVGSGARTRAVAAKLHAKRRWPAPRARSRPTLTGGCDSELDVEAGVRRDLLERGERLRGVVHADVVAGLVLGGLEVHDGLHG